MNEDWARLRRLVGKPNGSDHLVAAGKSSPEFPRTGLTGSSVSGNARSEAVRLAKRTELCGVLGRYWSSSLGGGFIFSTAPVQGAPDSGVWGPFL